VRSDEEFQEKKRQCGNGRFRKVRQAFWCLLLGEAELAALLFVFMLSISVRTEERSWLRTLTID
jgi:hypothetical protein